MGAEEAPAGRSRSSPRAGESHALGARRGERRSPAVTGYRRTPPRLDGLGQQRRRCCERGGRGSAFARGSRLARRRRARKDRLLQSYDVRYRGLREVHRIAHARPLRRGANADGAGVAMVMEAGRLIAALPQHPRRTVRVVLFMNEENGLAGGKGYATAHQGELARHVAALEADSGAGPPLAVHLRAGDGGASMLAPWLAPLASLGIGLEDGDASGADLGPLDPSGVPLFAVHPDVTHYFDIHHSAADTFDKIDPANLARNAAAIAVVAYALAEMPGTLPRPTPKPSHDKQEVTRPAAH